MQAMILNQLGSLAINHRPLDLVEIPKPVPGEKELLIRVETCGVCHTELDEIEGRTPPPQLPMILGHQVVGTVAEAGSTAGKALIGARVGVAWIYSACVKCGFCRRGL